MASFKVADASEYLAITGWGIDDVKLAKKAWVFVGQQCKKFSISLVNYEFEVHAMSAEKLPFILPAVFTIGPKISAIGATEADKKELEARSSSSTPSSSPHCTARGATSTSWSRASSRARPACWPPS
jgi:hypothetical protein